ncbi:MAG: hypothetical protein R2873_00115 [Caldilineaceae bacterium]
MSTQRACDVIIAESQPGRHAGNPNHRTVDGGSGQRVSIVLLTGFIDEELTFNVALHGIQDYLVKGEFDGAAAAHVALCHRPLPAGAPSTPCRVSNW